MKPIELPAELVDGLEAVATLERTTVVDLLTDPIRRLLRDRHDRLAEVLALLQPAAAALTGAVGYTATEEPPAVPEPVGHDAQGDHGAPVDDTPPPAADANQCQVEGCDRVPRTLRRGMCGMHYQRWQRGALAVAPDGTRSPKAPDDEQDAEDDPAPVAAVPDLPDEPSPGAPLPRPCCAAHGCGAPALPGGAKFCPRHTSEVPRIAEKLRRSGRARASDDAYQAAVELLIAGRAA